MWGMWMWDVDVGDVGDVGVDVQMWGWMST